MNKKLVACALAFTLALGTLPSAAFAADRMIGKNDPGGSWAECDADHIVMVGGKYAGCMPGANGSSSRSPELSGDDGGYGEAQSSSREGECHAYVKKAYDSPITSGIVHGLGTGGATYGQNRIFTGKSGRSKSFKSGAIVGGLYGAMSAWDQSRLRKTAYEQCMAYGAPSEYQARLGIPPR